MRVSLDIQRDASPEPQFEQKTHVLPIGDVIKRDGSTRFAYRGRHSADTHTVSFSGRSWQPHVLPIGDVIDRDGSTRHAPRCACRSILRGTPLRSPSSSRRPLVGRARACCGHTVVNSTSHNALSPRACFRRYCNIASVSFSLSLGRCLRSPSSSRRPLAGRARACCGQTVVSSTSHHAFSPRACLRRHCRIAYVPFSVSLPPPPSPSRSLSVSR